MSFPNARKNGTDEKTTKLPSKEGQPITSRPTITEMIKIRNGTMAAAITNCYSNAEYSNSYVAYHDPSLKMIKMYDSFSMTKDVTL